MNTQMKVTCYGSRGSIPSPSRSWDGFKTDKFGGNTTCYFLEAGPFKIMFDAGSGMAVLGNKLMATQFGPDGPVPQSFILLLSHYHADHMQGLPFCAPFYFPQNSFDIHGMHPREATNSFSDVENAVKEYLSKAQETPIFPVPHRSLPAHKNYTAHDPMFSESFTYMARNDHIYEMVGDGSVYKEGEYQIKVTTIPLNHPDGCLGFRIDYKGKTFVFCTDNEPFAFTNNKINSLAKGCDLILLDGQYTEQQISTMTQGFGHGTPELCVEQALMAEAKKLIIHHHDPSHDDKKLEEMYAELVNDKGVSKRLHDSMKPLKVDFAKEGHTWEI
jgi:phosphoribosyl 1,2-cyclic phosphodiesterase